MTKELFPASIMPSPSSDKDDATKAKKQQKPNTAHMKVMLASLSSLRLEDLRKALIDLSGSKSFKGNKAAFVEALAQLLSWKNSEEFESFFGSLPPALREAIERGCFYRFVDIHPLEKRHGITILESQTRFSCYIELSIRASSRFGLFRIVDDGTLEMPEAFRQAFRPWLPKPEGYEAQPLDIQPTNTWSNEGAAFESLRLALKAIAPLIKHDYDNSLPRKGLSKTSLKALRAASGFPTFPIATRYGLDALELLTRFSACISELPDKKVDDIDTLEYLRSSLALFLKQDQGAHYESYMRGPYFEINVLSDHLSRKPGTRIDLEPFSKGRVSFAAALRQAATVGCWYRAEDIVQAMILHGHSLGFMSEQDESYAFYVKGEAFEDHGRLHAQDVYEDTIQLQPLYHNRLITGPLFKAYCYLMAALGTVEISETEPPLDLVRKGKKQALCAYDCLYAFRVTELGRYCLGLSEQKPSEAAREYEAIADPDLPFVAFRGQSLEHRLFLESIGERLGQDRFRVSEVSLCAHCTNDRELAKKIADFRRLICKKPALHWESLFYRAMAKATAFASPQKAYIFSAPSDHASLQTLVQSPSLAGLFVRAEGGLIVVEEKNYRRFMKAAKALGYRPPEE